MRLVAAGLVERRSRGVGGLTGGRDGRLLTSHVAIEVVQRLLDLHLRRPEHVQLGRRLGPLRLQPLPAGVRIVRGRRGNRLAGDQANDDDGRGDPRKGRH